jgi:ATP-dependent DNA helicase PIF1
MTERAILAPKNEDVGKLNEEILSRIPGESCTLYSSDTLQDDGQTAQFPVEFLNSLTPSGLPPHKLILKKGAIVILLRNLDNKNGLCNGTRLIVRQCSPRVIEAEIATGKNSGKIVFLPRIPMDSSDGDLPFVFRRRQFPVKLAFAMSINKAQGQTMNKVGIYLQSEVFSHGQLYVALSRVTNVDNLVLLTRNGRKMSNVAYKEALL